jgi:BirA family biotin operon repressor/biotin-[acetyl-CoA-carboxylase] ligase
VKFTIQTLELCPSTNDLLKVMAARGAPEGTVVVARGQTAGRGTKGRTWYSPPGLGLYLSILLRPARDELSRLTFMAGLAARDAIRISHGLEVRLRWPNDIVYGGRKLGGILCEARSRAGRPDFAILGFGLNVNHTDEDFPDEIRPSAISLRQALGTLGDLERLRDDVLGRVDAWQGRLRRGDRGEIIRAFENAAETPKGSPLSLITGDDRLDGVFEGIDPQGRLLVRTAGGLRRFAGADVVKIV